MNLNESVISFEDVQVRHQNHVIFEQLSFSVLRGQHLAVVGASGSGKSALLNTIAGKLPVCAGKIEYPALDPSVSHHQQIAQVASRHHFQNRSNTTSFYYQQRFNSSDAEDAKTVEQYLSAVPGAGKAYWTIEKVIERLALSDLRTKHLIKLSNGESKRLLLASAILRNPALLLLDHPLAGLDTGARSDFNALLTEVARAGTTLVMATSPAEVPELFTHVMVLGKGGIQEVMNREDFDPGRYQVFQPSTVDPKELEQLLSLGSFPDFEHAVRMEDVSVRYNGKAILEDIRWEVKAGERWALLGPNGAGKSTLLSLINGDHPQAYANRIWLFDRRRGSGESIWDIKKKIGFVSPELFQYFPSRQSCLEVVESGFYDTLGLFRPSAAGRALLALRWMKLFGMEEDATVPFSQLSASRQRLCLLARALIKNPPLLIFDEACQGLDLQQKEHFKAIVDLICELSRVTIIYVSHYQDEIPDSVNRRLELSKGKICCEF